jgi:MFS family permease
VGHLFKPKLKSKSHQDTFVLAVLRQRNFGLLWGGQLISRLGDWAIYAALPYSIYEMTGSVLAAGTVFMMLTVPQLIFGSVAGVFVDRWDWRWTMIGANLLRGLLLTLLLTVRSAESIWLIYLVVFLEASASQFFEPANNALLPHLVDEEQLLVANSLDGFAENCARLLGPATAAGLLSIFGLNGVFLLDIGSYLIAGLLVYLIIIPAETVPKPDQSEYTAGTAWMSVWNQWVAGLRLVRNKTPLAAIFLVFSMALFADSIFTVLLPAFMQGMVGVGAVEYAWALTARGMGGIVGGLLVGYIGKHFKNGQMIGFGLVGAGLILLTMFHVPVFPVVLACFALLGVPVMAWLINSQTWLQSHAPDGYRGRVFGAFYTTNALMMLVGVGLGSSGGENLGVVPTLDIAGALFLLSGLLALVFMREEAVLQPVKVLDK